MTLILHRADFDERLQTVLATVASDISMLLSAISKLLWPAVIALIVVMFRGEIGERISMMRRFKTPGFEASFAEQADAIMRESGEIRDESASDESGDRSQKPLVQLAAVDPRTAIQQGWQSLRSATKVAVASLKEQQVRSTVRRVELLAERGLLDPSAAQLVAGLRALVVAARDPHQVVTASSAAAFVAATQNLEAALNQAVATKIDK